MPTKDTRASRAGAQLQNRRQQIDDAVEGRDSSAERKRKEATSTLAGLLRSLHRRRTAQTTDSNN